MRSVSSFVVLLALVSTACGGALKVKEYTFCKEAPPVDAIVILHPDFYFRGMESHQVYEKWMDLAHRLTKRTGVVVIAPDEYTTLTDGMVTNLAYETDLATVLKPYGLKVENTIALRLMLVESWQEVQKVVTKKDKKRASRAEFESEMKFTADVYHVGTSQPLLTYADGVSGTVYDEPDEADPRPEITSFALRNYNGLIQALQSKLKVRSRAGSAVKLGLAENPLESLDYQYQTLPPLRKTLEKKDDLERDAVIRARITYRYPTLERGAVRKLQAGTKGVLVTGAAPCTNLKPGDVILEADGVPIRREYHLRGLPAFTAAAPGAPTLKVLRESSTVTIVVECGGKK